MLVRINKVLEAKTSKKAYGKTLLGKVMFPAAGVTLKEGSWGVCNSVIQTKTKNAAGELIDIVGDKPVLTIVQSLFDTKELAIKAIVEEQSGDTDLVAAMKAVVGEFSFEDLKALENAAI